jgi:hypothetical protein
VPAPAAPSPSDPPVSAEPRPVAEQHVTEAFLDMASGTIGELAPSSPPQCKLVGGRTWVWLSHPHGVDYYDGGPCGKEVVENKLQPGHWYRASPRNSNNSRTVWTEDARTCPVTRYATSGPLQIRALHRGRARRTSVCNRGCRQTFIQRLALPTRPNRFRQASPGVRPASCCQSTNLTDPWIFRGRRTALQARHVLRGQRKDASQRARRRERRYVRKSRKRGSGGSRSRRVPRPSDLGRLRAS